MPFTHFFKLFLHSLSFVIDIVYGTSCGPVPGISVIYTCTRPISGTSDNWIHLISTIFSQRIEHGATNIYEYAPACAMVKLYWVRSVPVSVVFEYCHLCAQSELILTHFPSFSTEMHMFYCSIDHSTVEYKLIYRELNHTLHRTWSSCMPPEMPYNYSRMVRRTWFKQYL
jgi:hypothetical protein